MVVALELRVSVSLPDEGNARTNPQREPRRLPRERVPPSGSVPPLAFRIHGPRPDKLFLRLESRALVEPGFAPEAGGEGAALSRISAS